MFDGNFRTAVDKRTAPLGRSLAWLGVSPDLLTGIGVVGSLAAAVVIALGDLGLGAVLLLLGIVPDLLDGPLAKAAQAVSKRGAFFDSFADRVSDLAVFSGIGIYLIARGDQLFGILSFIGYGLASLISYQRAKAESLGFNAKGGLMERAERVLLLLMGVTFPALLQIALVAVAAGSVLTVVQRFLKIWRQASHHPDRIQAASRMENLRRANRRRRSRDRGSLRGFLNTYEMRNFSGRKGGFRRR